MLDNRYWHGASPHAAICVLTRPASWRFDKQAWRIVREDMKKFAGTILFFCASAIALIIFVSARSSEIKSYTADDLIGLTCEELGERHEEVIFAYHDAEISYYKRAGAFHDDLGLPEEDILPFVVFMRRFMQDNDINEVDLAKPSSPLTTIQGSEFYHEVSGICAANPMLEAVEAMRRAAMNLSLID